MHQPANSVTQLKALDTLPKSMHLPRKVTAQYQPSPCDLGMFPLKTDSGFSDLMPIVLT
jgi:hypothetical protein